MSERAAPSYPLPPTPYYSVEYPGYVSEAAIPKAIQNLGGTKKLETSFRKNVSVDVRLRPEDPYAHPVPGDVVRTSKVILKVTKRRKKSRMEIDGDLEDAGEYTAEITGSSTKTIRFRSLADFQFAPDRNDRIYKLRSSLEQMDARAIQNFTFEPELEDYTVFETINQSSTATSKSSPDGLSLEQNELSSIGDTIRDTGDDQLPEAQRTTTISHSNLRLFPPPLFSRQGIQQNYNYKGKAISNIQTVIDKQTGEEKQRLANRSHVRLIVMITISIDDDIPTGPTDAMLAGKQQYDQNLIERARQKFEERPMWTRFALLSQFNSQDAREFVNNRSILAFVAFAYQDGPFQDTLVRFGYDPRVTPESRIYQRVFFRNRINHAYKNLGRKVNDHRNHAPDLAIHPTSSTSNVLSVQDMGESSSGSLPQPHIFDGQTLSPDATAFQICDITDPILKLLLSDQSAHREEFDYRDGWYQAGPFNRIKVLMRRKFMGLKEGKTFTAEESMRFLQEEAGAGMNEDGEWDPHMKILKSAQGYRRRKKNRAKTDLSEAEKQAARLREALHLQEPPDDDDDYVP